MVRSLALCALLLVIASPSPARGQNVETAGALYDNAVEAQARGEYGRAAALFARADELLPDPVALEAAIGAALLANDAALAMALVDRSRRGPMPRSLAAVVRRADQRFGDRIGALVVRCEDCTAIVDGAPVKTGHRLWLPVGSHRVDVASGGALARHDVTVVARETIEIGADPTSAPPLPEEPARPAGRDRSSADARAGLSPAWFWAGAGLTAVTAGFAVASGIDTLSLHDAFEANPSRQLATDGRSAETRTYVLWGVAGALGVATGIVGLTVVDWGGNDGGSTVAARLSPLRIDVSARF